MQHPKLYWNTNWLCEYNELCIAAFLYKVSITAAFIELIWISFILYAVVLRLPARFGMRKGMSLIVVKSKTAWWRRNTISWGDGNKLFYRSNRGREGKWKSFSCVEMWIWGLQNLIIASIMWSVSVVKRD